MPRVSERQKLIYELDLMIKVLASYDEEETCEFKELLDIKGMLESSRFINFKTIIEKNRSMRYLLWGLPTRLVNCFLILLF